MDEKNPNNPVEAALDMVDGAGSDTAASDTAAAAGAATDSAAASPQHDTQGMAAPEADPSQSAQNLLEHVFGVDSQIVKWSEKLTDTMLVDTSAIQISLFNVIVSGIILLVAFSLTIGIRLWLKRRLFSRWNLDQRIQNFTFNSVNVLTVLGGFYYALLALHIPIDRFLNRTLFTIKDTQITLSSLIAAGVFIMITIFASRWIRMLMQKRLFQKWDIDEGAQFMFMRLVHYIIMVAGILVAVQSLGIQPTMFVGMLAVLGVGIGFGLQNLTSNFISGIILLFERPIRVGDRITVEDLWGDVVQINLRTTVVNSVDNVSVIIPNSKLLENNLINWSYGDPKIRIHVPVGVAYGSDIDAVTEAILHAAEECKDVMKEPKPEVWFREFGDSSLNFELICWLPRSNRREQAKDALNRSIDRNFRNSDIEIPFPQRDLHIRPSDAELRVRLVADPGVLPEGTKLEQVPDDDDKKAETKKAESSKAPKAESPSQTTSDSDDEGKTAEEIYEEEKKRREEADRDNAANKAEPESEGEDVNDAAGGDGSPSGSGSGD